MEPRLHPAGCCWLAFSCIRMFCTPLCPSGQSITAINAGPQDTQQKGKNQWAARAGDLLAFPVKAEQELCCGLPLAKSIGHGYAVQCMYGIYLLNAMWRRNEATWSCNMRHGMVLLVSGGSHCFFYSIFMVSHTHSGDSMYEFSVWIQGKLAFKNKHYIGDEELRWCPFHRHATCISNYAKKKDCLSPDLCYGIFLANWYLFYKLINNHSRILTLFKYNMHNWSRIIAI